MCLFVELPHPVGEGYELDDYRIQSGHSPDTGGWLYALIWALTGVI